MCALKLVPSDGLYRSSSSDSSLSSMSPLSTISPTEYTAPTLYSPIHTSNKQTPRTLISVIPAETGEAWKDGREPWSSFKFKVLALVAELFPDVEASAQLIIEEVGNGAFNRVIGVTIPRCKKRHDSDVLTSDSRSRASSLAKPGLAPGEYVIRVLSPLEGLSEKGFKSDLLQDVAILQVLGSRLKIPIPKVFKYDLNVGFALEQPYMLQNRLRGDPLELLWDSHPLTPAQIVSAVEQITKIIEKIAAVTAPAAGYILTDNIYFPSSSNIDLKQFPVPTDKCVAAGWPASTMASDQPAPTQTPLEFLVDQCHRWISYEESIEKPSPSFDLWSRIIFIAHSLQRHGWLGDRFHLVHDDLFERNILAEVKDSSKVEITGIVNWDMSFFAPKCVAFRPPYWAWADFARHERDEDNAMAEPQDKLCILLKNAFRKVASEEFIRFALSQEGVLARKLFRVAKEGVKDSRGWNLAIQLFRQWHELCPEDHILPLDGPGPAV